MIGSHGQTLAGEILLGGVACAVIHSAVRPVLIIRLKKYGERERSFSPEKWDPTEHILFPTDFSANAEIGFRYLKEIAASGGKKITLVHIQDKERIASHMQERLEEFNEIDKSRLEKMRNSLKEVGKVEVNIEISYGSPISEILRLIKKLEVDLVVMGSQGRGYIQEIFLGSVSHNIARTSHAPVLLVPIWMTYTQTKGGKYYKKE